MSGTETEARKDRKGPCCCQDPIRQDRCTEIIDCDCRGRLGPKPLLNLFGFLQWAHSHQWGTPCFGKHGGMFELKATRKYK